MAMKNTLSEIPIITVILIITSTTFAYSFEKTECSKKYDRLTEYIFPDKGFSKKTIECKNIHGGRTLQIIPNNQSEIIRYLLYFNKLGEKQKIVYFLPEKTGIQKGYNKVIKYKNKTGKTIKKERYYTDETTKKYGIYKSILYFDVKRNVLKTDVLFSDQYAKEHGFDKRVDYFKGLFITSANSYQNYTASLRRFLLGLAGRSIRSSKCSNISFGFDSKNRSAAVVPSDLSI